MTSEKFIWVGFEVWTRKLPSWAKYAHGSYDESECGRPQWI